jgi:2-dehydro-3-deoxyphosphooctonate aldolase (KDO 8-P synthase)
MVKKIKIGEFEIGQGCKPCLIAGPCVIENEILLFEIAGYLKSLTEKEKIPFIFKASFDKANRSSVKSFRGPGFKEGLRILKKVRAKFNVPVISDIHCVTQAEPAGEILDIIQIPAFLCRQTDLLTAAGKTGKTVNVKKGQFLSPWEIKNVIDKVTSTGNEKIMITERGFSFGYNNLVTDFRALPIMRNFGYPVIYDATHSLQQPGGLGTTTGGNSEFVPYMAKAAMAVGCDGIFMEVHPSPEKALSDGPNMVKLNEAENIIKDVFKIYEALKNDK